MTEIKSINKIESKMAEIDSSSYRYEVLESAKHFKTNWIELGKHLYTVKKDKLFKEWGYINFDTYCTKEIGIRKQTAFKLLSSYFFLSREEPQYLETENITNRKPNQLPGYESIDILRRAKANKNFKDDNYNRLKEEVFEKATEPKELGKQFRSMLWAVKNTDPEEERKKRRIYTIKRLIGTLKTLKQEAEILNILPGAPIKEIEKIISILETALKKL